MAHVFQIKYAQTRAGTDSGGLISYVYLSVFILCCLAHVHLWLPFENPSFKYTPDHLQHGADPEDVRLRVQLREDRLQLHPRLTHRQALQKLVW